MPSVLNRSTGKIFAIILQQTFRITVISSDFFLSRDPKKREQGRKKGESSKSQDSKAQKAAIPAGKSSHPPLTQAHQLHADTIHLLLTPMFPRHCLKEKLAS